MRERLSESTQLPSSHRTISSNAAARWTLAGQSLLLLALAGCPVSQTLPEQAKVRDFTEPATGRDYLLYVPSVYTKEREWPLVVACHGTWPYDSAKAQMQEWAKFAEYKGVIIAAPTLVSSRGDFPPAAEKQIELEERDAKAITAVVDEVRRRFSISNSRIFITSWSAGAYPALYTALRHPDIFRAVFLRQCNFDEKFMPLAGTEINRWQQVKIVYGRSDMIRDQAKACAKWLRDNKGWVEEQEIAGVHSRTDPNEAWNFFEKVVKKHPWIQVFADRADGEGPLAMRFRVDTIPAATKLKWFFGDGAESYDPSPVHAYERPGPYTLRVNVQLKSGKVYTRTKDINVVRVHGKPD